MVSKFEYLIRDLLILSSEKEDQINLIGNGNVGTEMLINFGLSNQNLAQLANQKVINDIQKAALEDFQFDIDYNLNLDGNLESDEWKKTREKAKDILKILNASHFKVILDKSGKFWEARLIE